MEASALKLYTLSYKDVRTYTLVPLFVLGNIALPQLVHLIPGGGLTLLPIYFFTLIAAYKYGWKAGLLTAVLSPLINHLLFGMPPAAVLPAIMMKSTLLALSAGFAATYFKKLSITILALVVLTYQVVGTLGEWALTGSFYTALQDFRIGIPGMVLQVAGGYLLIKYIIRK